MKTKLLKLSAFAIVVAATSPAAAGGLADAITEREPVAVEQVTQGAIPGWVVPAIALLLIGAAVSSSGSDSDSVPEDSVVEPVDTVEPVDPK